MTTRFPARKFHGSAMQTQLMSMMTMRDTLDAMLDREGYDGRRVLGYKLPKWQRKEKWSDEQCRVFITSIWLGVSLGSYMVNMSMKNADVDNILLDGQQRLRAIERYWNNEFAVSGDDGLNYFWKDLTEKEHAHFLRIPFPWIQTQFHTDVEAKEAYNRHNFGGTPHTPDELAM